MTFGHIGCNPYRQGVGTHNRDVEDRHIHDTVGSGVERVDAAIDIGSPDVGVGHTSHNIDFLRVAMLPEVLRIGGVALGHEPLLVGFEIVSERLQSEDWGTVVLVVESIVVSDGIASGGYSDNEVGGTGEEGVSRQVDDSGLSPTERAGPIEGGKSSRVVRMQESIADGGAGYV